MKMYFYPDIFERIHESKCYLKLKKCELKNCELKERKQICELKKRNLTLINSFTLYMLLQLQAKGERFGEHKITLEVLRPYFSPTNDKRKDKGIIYLFDVLQGAGLITFGLKKQDVIYRFIECAKTIIGRDGYPRHFILIRECNRHLIENQLSVNAPFALYCLLRSVQRSEDGLQSGVYISFKEMERRLNISLTTLNNSKNRLEKDGYLLTHNGERKENSKERYVNEYWLLNYDKRKPEVYELSQIRKQERENRCKGGNIYGKKKRSRKKSTND